MYLHTVALSASGWSIRFDICVNDIVQNPNRKTAAFSNSLGSKNLHSPNPKRNLDVMESVKKVDTRRIQQLSAEFRPRNLGQSFSAVV